MSNRSIGASFEREVAHFLKRWWPGAKRGFQDRSGEDVPDVIGTPYWVECKSYKSVSRNRIEKFYWKAMDDSKQKVMPILFYKNKKGGKRYSYNKVVLHRDTLWELETKGKHTLDDKEYFGNLAILVEISPDDLSDLFDYNYDITEAKDE